MTGTIFLSLSKQIFLLLAEYMFWGEFMLAQEMDCLLTPGENQ